MAPFVNSEQLLTLLLTVKILIMHSKSQFYLSQCIEAASKSSMAFTLGSIIVKGGKVISMGYNHQRVHYDELSVDSAFGKPVSMHAEMHAIYNLTGGRSPPFKQQVQPDPQPHKRKRQAGGGEDFQRSLGRICTLSELQRLGWDVLGLAGDGERAPPLYSRGHRLMPPCFSIDRCDWAGIKRIFYWSESDRAFCCIKVADAKNTRYETQADVRLFGGALRSG
ncbi:hypothetical protein DFS33DRAFT_1445071 [Desarmillaria ectypa]|nr:hypothetical protein DFS33DRAFT_1445071 [Desarmillaria ectypa]